MSYSNSYSKILPRVASFSIYIAFLALLICDKLNFAALKSILLCPSGILRVCWSS